MIQLLLNTVFCLILGCGALVRAQNSPQQASEKAKRSREAIIVLARQADYFDVAPVYRLLIYPDGSVAFIGQKNVKTKGLARDRISQQDLQRLVREFEKIDYFSLRERYENTGDGCPNVGTDASSVYTSINFRGRKKSVLHYLGCNEGPTGGFVIFPQELSRLEDLIDVVVKSARWVK